MCFRASPNTSSRPWEARLRTGARSWIAPESGFGAEWDREADGGDAALQLAGIACLRIGWSCDEPIRSAQGGCGARRGDSRTASSRSSPGVALLWPGRRRDMGDGRCVATLRHCAVLPCIACVPASASLPWRSSRCDSPCFAKDQPAHPYAGVRRMRLTPVPSFERCHLTSGQLARIPLSPSTHRPRRRVLQCRRRSAAGCARGKAVEVRRVHGRGSLTRSHAGWQATEAPHRSRRGETT